MDARLSEDGKTIIIRIPYRFRRNGCRKEIVAPEGAISAFLPVVQRDESLVRAMAKAYRWREILESGGAESIHALAEKEKVDPSYLARHLRLTLLAPDIVTAIMAGKQPDGMTLTSLWKPFPSEWVYQREHFGFAGGG